MPIRILVFCGDSYHSPAITRTGLALLAASGECAFDWIEGTRDDWSPALLNNYAAVLIAANLGFEFEMENTPSQTAWQNYLNRGGGMIVVHSGNAGRRSTESVASVTGATFIEHPPLCTVELAPLSGHPLTREVNDVFTISDEQYCMSVHESDLDIFLTSRTVHGVQPAGWTRSLGQGRVCALTPGHGPEVWQHSAFQKLLQNAIRWASADHAG